MDANNVKRTAHCVTQDGSNNRVDSSELRINWFEPYDDVSNTCCNCADLYLAYLPKSNKKALLSQRRPRDAPNIWVPKKFRESSQTPPATFPEICKGLLFRSILRMCIQNL